MFGKRPPHLAGLIAAVLALTSATAQAQTLPWRPFTRVHTVCYDDREAQPPEGCEDDAFDQLHLTNGERIRAWILLEHPSFYVVTRHGELRAVDKARVARVERTSRSGRPSAEGHDDQVVLDSGHVLSGTLVKETELPPYLQVRSPDGRFTYTAHGPQVVMVVRKGQEARPQWP